MPYTFKPKQKFSKSFGRNLRISRKDSVVICRVIKKKKLKTAKRLLEDLLSKRRNLKGKYYSKAVEEILNLLQSCEKNAEYLGLDKNKLFVHASAHQGSISRRRRRKSAFGSRMKMTNIEIFLIERGKEKESKEKKNVPKEEKKIVEVKQESNPAMNSK